MSLVSESEFEFVFEFVFEEGGVGRSAGRGVGLFHGDVGTS
jgi:hypothetical protein